MIEPCDLLPGNKKDSQCVLLLPYSGGAPLEVEEKRMESPRLYKLQMSHSLAPCDLDERPLDSCLPPAGRAAKPLPRRRTLAADDLRSASRVSQSSNHSKPFKDKNPVKQSVTRACVCVCGGSVCVCVCVPATPAPASCLFHTSS